MTLSIRIAYVTVAVFLALLIASPGLFQSAWDADPTKQSGRRKPDQPPLVSPANTNALQPFAAPRAAPELSGRVDSVVWEGEACRFTLTCGPGQPPPPTMLQPDGAQSFTRSYCVNVGSETAFRDETGTKADLEAGRSVRVRYNGTLFMTYPVQVDAESVHIEAE